MSAHPVSLVNSSLAPASDACASTDARPVLLHFIHSPGGGGAEAMLRGLVSHLRRDAWRVVVVTVDGRPYPAEKEELRSHGARVIDLQSGAMLCPAVIRRLRTIIREEKPAVVQTWMHHADLVGGLAARLSGARHILWSIHCREIHRNPGDGALKMAAFRTALSLLSRVVPRRIVSCSQAAIEDHAARGYPRRKMQWIPNGVCTETYVPHSDGGTAARLELGLPPEGPLVGFAGRFHEMKQLPVFLRAAAMLQARRPGVRFVLCGGTENMLDGEGRAALAGMQHRENVRFIPFRENMARFYPALSLFSLSSRTEACPVTLLEAMSCGIPCAATDVGDCASLLPGRVGVVPPGDATALAEAWERILAVEPAESIRRPQLLRQHVEQNFSIAQTARSYESLYSSMIQKTSVA